MFILPEGDVKTNTWRWLFVSEVFVWFPTPKSEAMRITGSHVAQVDQALIPTLGPVWEPWDKFPESQAAPPVQTKDIPRSRPPCARPMRTPRSAALVP